MTGGALAEIKAMVDELAGSIASDSDGNEEWHGAEDTIMATALQRIADGCAGPQAVAREALRVEQFDFERWYA
jgi:hypothetical protein